MVEPINLFVPTFRVEETLSQIRECLEKGWTGLGFKTIEFEESWKEYTGLPNAHFLNSATSGLHLAVRLLKEEGEWQGGRNHHHPPDVCFNESRYTLRRTSPRFCRH